MVTVIYLYSLLKYYFVKSHQNNFQVLRAETVRDQLALRCSFRSHKTLCLFITITFFKV